MTKRLQRKGIIRSIGATMVHQYEKRNGVQTCTGAPYMVRVQFEITDGPDAGRWVSVLLTAEQAEQHKAHLTGAINTINVLNSGK